MFSLDIVSTYEICLSLILVVVVGIFFYIVRFSVHEKIDMYLNFLKRVEKLIKSGQIFMLSSKLKIQGDNQDNSDKNTDGNSLSDKISMEDEFICSLVSVLDKGIRCSVREQERLNFLKTQLKSYLSFLNERSYFFLILKNKIILMFLVALIIRWVVLSALNSNLEFKEFIGIDAFFVLSDLAMLILVGIKLKRKFDLDFISSKQKELHEWVDLYFWKAFCDRGIKSLVYEQPTKMSERVLSLYRKQLKEGVSYCHDIQEYLEECFSLKMEQEKNEFKKVVEFFPLIELALIGGSVFMLISVPICTII